MNRDRSKALNTFDRQFADQNRRATERVFRPANRWSETAPMPADPNDCRWCGGRLKLLANDVLYCQAGCEPNTSAPFKRVCYDCGKEYETGARGTTQCYPCDSKDKAEHAAEAKRVPHLSHRGYHDPFHALPKKDDK